MERKDTCLLMRVVYMFNMFVYMNDLYVK